MQKKQVIKYLKNFKQRLKSKGNYWTNGSSYIDNAIAVLEEKGGNL